MFKDKEAQKGTPFTSENQPEKHTGPRRSTIAKWALDLKLTTPEQIIEQLSPIYPGIEKSMTAENLIYLAHVINGISDVNSAKFVIDSAYGAPKQDIDHTSGGEKIHIPAPIVYSTAPPLLTKE
jgi:hypothetical protein